MRFSPRGSPIVRWIILARLPLQRIFASIGLTHCQPQSRLLQVMAWGQRCAKDLGVAFVAGPGTGRFGFGFGSLGMSAKLWECALARFYQQSGFSFLLWSRLSQALSLVQGLGLVQQMFFLSQYVLAGRGRPQRKRKIGYCIYILFKNTIAYKPLISSYFFMNRPSHQILLMELINNRYSLILSAKYLIGYPYKNRII